MHSAAGSQGAFALWFLVGVAWGFSLARLDRWKVGRGVSSTRDGAE